MLRYDRQTKPGLVALYDIRPGNGAGPFLQPRSPHGSLEAESFKLRLTFLPAWLTNLVAACGSAYRYVLLLSDKYLTTKHRSFVSAVHEHSGDIVLARI